MLRRGVIAVVFKRIGRFYNFAVLERCGDWKGWELIKGGIKPDESDEEAIKREILEESGINEILRLEKLDGIVSWSYKKNGQKINAEYLPFMAEVGSEERIKVSNGEHEQHKLGFFLNIRDAKDIVRYKEHRKLLEIVREKLGIR